MKIHADEFGGMGDMVCFAWIGEAARRMGRPLEFFATGWRAMLLGTLFAQKLALDPAGAVHLRSGFEEAWRAGSKVDYIGHMAAQCGLSLDGVYACRPEAKIKGEDKLWARPFRTRALLFPGCSKICRQWPVAYWLELASLMQGAGMDVAFVTPKRDLRFEQGGHPALFDLTLTQLAAAVQVAPLVIGTDSGHAHLAGTLGTTTIALCGPTGEAIYEYNPSVVCLRAGALACGGCYYQGPAYRVSCEQGGCHDLYRLFPERVLEFVKAVLCVRASQ